MDLLDPETEELLKEILDNEKDYPSILRHKLEQCNNWADDQKLRSQIKLLRENGYISRLSWDEGVPLLGRIEQKGRNYFIMKQSKHDVDKVAINENKVFISHSSKDEEFVIKLEQLFELLGVDHDNIFCSSIEGQGVKHGNKIEEAVRNEIIEDKILIYIISKNFFDSNYCLNELGAGWILSDSRIQNKHLFHIKLPDISFDDIKGFISSGDKCTECNVKSITAFVEEFEEALSLPPKKPTTYRNLVDNFINEIQLFIEVAEQTYKLSQEELKNKEIMDRKYILSIVTDAEKEIIKSIFNSKSGEVTLNPTSAVVVGMQEKGIIYTGTSYYNLFKPRGSYALNTWVYETLKSDSELKNKILAEE
ncbi:MAG: toll/interleukin-1 receptor domain-containing protein [Bacilli bacterium]|nr:toll/interleukin-1 receptor domain-containing protein [Bacilli bacterium]